MCFCSCTVKSCLTILLRRRNEIIGTLINSLIYSFSCQCIITKTCFCCCHGLYSCPCRRIIRKRSSRFMMCLFCILYQHFFLFSSSDSLVCLVPQNIWGLFLYINIYISYISSYFGISSKAWSIARPQKAISAYTVDIAQLWLEMAQVNPSSI